jgi:ankyrin repeat protein
MVEFILSLHKVDERSIIDIFRYLTCNVLDTDTIIRFYDKANLKAINLPSYVHVFKCHCNGLTIYQNCNLIKDLEFYSKNHDDCLNGHRIILNTFSTRNTIKFGSGLKHQRRPEYYYIIGNERTEGDLFLFTDPNSFFVYQCECNNIQIVNRLIMDGHIDVNYDNGLPLTTSLRKGHFEIARNLYLAGARMDNDFQLLCKLCIKGYREIVELMAINGSISNLEDITKCFQLACTSKHLDIAFFLYSSFRNKIDISRNNNNILRQCCRLGHVHIVEWLYSLYKEKPDIQDSFIQGCIGNNLNVVELLYSLEKIDIFMKDNEIIDVCCYRNNIEIIKWIFTKKEIDKDKLYDIVFQKSCKYNQFHIIQWLFLLDSNRFINLARNNFYLIALTDNVEIAKYLITNGKITVDDELIDLCHKHKSYSILQLF